MKKSRPEWYLQGTEPDYRFSLANERTFLAWIRTALAFLAVSLAIKQVAQHYALDSYWVLYAALCAGAAVVLSVAGYRKWKRSEIAMRLSEPLPHNPALVALTWFMLGLSLSFIMLMVW